MRHTRTHARTHTQRHTHTHTQTNIHTHKTNVNIHARYRKRRGKIPPPPSLNGLPACLRCCAVTVPKKKAHSQARAFLLRTDRLRTAFTSVGNKLDKRSSSQGVCVCVSVSVCVYVGVGRGDPILQSVVCVPFKRSSKPQNEAGGGCSVSICRGTKKALLVNTVLRLERLKPGQAELVERRATPFSSTAALLCPLVEPVKELQVAPLAVY